MRLPQLLVYFDTSPALHLLESANAPFIIDFLDRQFKQTGRIAISHSELLSALQRCVASLILMRGLSANESLR